MRQSQNLERVQNKALIRQEPPVRRDVEFSGGIVQGPPAPNASLNSAANAKLNLGMAVTYLP
jgi:hypothetical protein